MITFNSSLSTCRRGALYAVLAGACLTYGCGGGGPPSPPSPGTPDASTPVVPPTLSVITHHNSRTRDGLYVVPGLTRAAAATLQQDTGFTAAISGPTYAHPLFFDAGAGGKDLVIVATERNDVYALDAGSGAPVWHVNLGPSVPLDKLPCGNIDPLGITGTPYLDEASKTIYLDAMMLIADKPQHHIFALSLTDGSPKAGWPTGGIDANATVKHGNFTFDSSVQNQRGALLLQGDTLYVPYGGHFGDCGEYRGWLVGVPLANPSAPKAWATRAEGAGSWAPSGVASDGSNVYISTGNGFGATVWTDQEAIVRFAPGPVFSEKDADYWAATDWKMLDQFDIDLGGSGPVLVHVDGATPADLAVALGKDGKVYLINRASMGGVSNPVATLSASEDAIITAAAAFPSANGVNVTFHGIGKSCPAGQSGDLTTVKITATSPPKLETTWCANAAGSGSPMVTTTDGRAESIVWTIGSEDSQQLRGFNGDTGAVIFAGTGTNVGHFNRFVSPIVGKGRIYVAGETGVYAFKAHP